MTATLRRLLALAGASRARLAIAVLLGTATIVFGVGLMATAGYLISRAAERPAILSLTVAIVGVRFFGIARPVVRYFERLRSHELAFRVLERVRRRVYERIEPLSPVQLQGDRRGETLSTLVSDVDSQQNLHLRGIAPPLVALAAGAVSVGVAAAFLPAAGIVLATGLLAAGLGAPALSAALSRRAGGREAAARGELAAELVEITSGSVELVAYGRQRDHLEQLRAADRRLVRLRRRAALADGLGDGLRLLLMGATVVAVLAVGVSSHASGGLNRVLIAMLALLALASFEAVQPLPEAARELGETVAAGRRIFALTDRKPAVVDATKPAALPDGPFTVALEDVRVRYGPGEPLALDGFSLRLEPVAASR